MGFRSAAALTLAELFVVAPVMAQTAPPPPTAAPARAPGAAPARAPGAAPAQAPGAAPARAPGAAPARVPRPPPMPPIYGRPYRGAVPIQLSLASSEPDVTLSLYSEDADTDTDRPFYVCAHPPCWLFIWPGTYKVYAGGSDGTLSGSHALKLKTSTGVLVEPVATAHRTAGLMMGIGGLAMIGAGGALLFTSIAFEGHQTAAMRARGQAGGLLLLGGLVFTPIGWVMFGGSFTPGIKTQTARTAQAARSFNRSSFAPGLSARFHF